MRFILSWFFLCFFIISTQNLDQVVLRENPAPRLQHRLPGKEWRAVRHGLTAGFGHPCRVEQTRML